MDVITLVPTDSSHIRPFYEFESDPTAVHMAAFASLPKDFDSFFSTWQRRIKNPASIHRTILLNDIICGGIMSYEMESKRHIGYWIDRQHWGKGVATKALQQFLEVEKTRPIYATCVADNIGSRKVLERNGFDYTHSEYHPAPARHETVEEAFFILK